MKTKRKKNCCEKLLRVSSLWAEGFESSAWDRCDLALDFITRILEVCPSMLDDPSWPLLKAIAINHFCSVKKRENKRASVHRVYTELSCKSYSRIREIEILDALNLLEKMCRDVERRLIHVCIRGMADIQEMSTAALALRYRISRNRARAIRHDITSKWKEITQ